MVIIAEYTSGPHQEVYRTFFGSSSIGSRKSRIVSNSQIVLKIAASAARRVMIAYGLLVL